MSELFEAGMIICFGISWPLSLYKSIVSRTTKGKSLLFELFIWLGYVCGVCGKFVTHNISYVLVFYIINLIMVSADIICYFRNRRLDQMAAH